MSININLRQMVYAMADALDLVGIDNIEHSKRVAIMAWTCGQALQLEQNSLNTLFHAALLHDCGISSSCVRRENLLVEELEWNGAHIHCQLGYQLLYRVPPLANLSPIVLHHHTRWEQLQDTSLSDEQKLIANLVFLLDRVDALTSFGESDDILSHKTAIRQLVKEKQSSLFAPELVQVFRALSEKEAFWLTLESRHLARALWQLEEEHDNIQIDLSELKQLANVFASLVDAKSTFTLEHSQGVARLARYLAQQLNFPTQTCDKIEIAGLLHDLGKLKIPDAILEKPGTLTPEERSLINHHSFETYQILSKVRGLEDIACWAGFHHERPSGNGYPFRLKGDEVSLEARVIGVADVFQALAQKRPYRDSLSPQLILKILHQITDQEGLDQTLVDLVAANLDRCWTIATGAELEQVTAFDLPN